MADPASLQPALLAIDVGNTQTQVGVFSSAGELLAEWRLSTARNRTVDELGLLIRSLFDARCLSTESLRGFVCASVVPPLTGVLEGVASEYFGLRATVVTAALVSDLPVLYEPPTDVGADRLVNAVAARELYGVPAVVVDFGTATTFDVIDAKGAYLGGVIATGIGVSADALFAHAARLPRVDVARPESVIGRSTVASLQAGLFFGYVELVDGLLQRIRAELAEGLGDSAGSELEPKVIATGGWAQRIGSECRGIEIVDALLTLQGLRIIYERHGDRAGGADPASEST